MAIDKKKLRQQMQMRIKNYAFPEYRPFAVVPKNCVLIVENNLFKTAKVVDSGFYISLFPWIKTVGVSLETYIYDFPPEKFQAGALLVSNNDENEKYDIVIDAAISYRILGGDKAPKFDRDNDVLQANETIRSKEKFLRRQWREKHGALKVYYDLKNKRENIEKQIQTTVYDALRFYVATHTYEDILAAQIDENSDLNQNIKHSLEPFGIEVVNFKIQKVNQEKSIDEAEARRKVIESDANAKANARKIEAEAEAAAIKATGLAQAEVEGQKIQSKVDAYGNRTYQEIAAINGQDFKQVNLNLGGAQIPTNVENLTQEQLTGLMVLLNNLQQKTQNKPTIPNSNNDGSDVEMEIQQTDLLQESNDDPNWDFDGDIEISDNIELQNAPVANQGQLKNHDIIKTLEDKRKRLTNHQTAEEQPIKVITNAGELDEIVGSMSLLPNQVTTEQAKELGKQYTLSRGHEQ